MSRRVLIGISAVLVNFIVLRSPAMSQASCKSALQDYRVAVQTYQDGLFDPAIAGFEAYLKQCPDGDYAGQTHYVLATLYAKRSEPAKVLPHVQKALSHQLDPQTRPHALFLGAQSALKTGKPGVAREYLHEVVTAQVDSRLKASAFYWLGEIAYQQQDVETAQRYYQGSVEASPTGAYAPYAHYSLGWLARQRGDTQAALDAFSTFLQVAPQHEFAIQARFARADLLREIGDIKAAAAAFRQLAQERPAGLQDEVLFRWAEMAYQLQQYDEARMAYRQLLKLFPQSRRVGEALYGLGWTALRQQQCEAAVEPWQTLLQRDPDVEQAPDIHYHLGKCYIELAQYPVARRHLKLVLASQTATAQQREEGVLKLAALAFRAQDYAEAIQYYAQALETASPDDAFRLHYLLGESHHAAGATADAMRHWQQALEGPQSLPFYPQALYRLGTAHLAQRAWHKAIPALRQLWDSYPKFDDRPAVAAGLAQAYGQTRQCEEALSF
jgi:tetratricopeptide (TPR) repeat protein